MTSADAIQQFKRPSRTLITRTDTIILGDPTGSARWHLSGDRLGPSPIRYGSCAYTTGEARTLQQTESDPVLIIPARDRVGG